MYRVDIGADLNDDDGSGYLWAFLDAGRDPGLVKAGAVLMAGSEDAAAMCEVTRLESADGGSTIVHLRVLPGMAEDYLGAAGRTLVAEGPFLEEYGQEKAVLSGPLTYSSKRYLRRERFARRCARGPIVS